MSRSMEVHNKIEPRESLTSNSPSSHLSHSSSLTPSSLTPSALTPSSLAAAKGLLGMPQHVSKAQKELFAKISRAVEINGLSSLSQGVAQEPLSAFAKCCSLFTPAAGKIVENTRKLIFGDNHSA